MEKIVVAGPFNDAMKRALESELSESFILRYITSKDEYAAFSDADYVILRTLEITTEDMAAMGRVRLIQRWGAGFDTVDIAAAAARGIPVAVTYGINATPVAEMAIALTLAVYRHLPEQTNKLMAGEWDRSYDKCSYTIFGKTVGIIGMGNIGRKVAALYRAFGARVIYYDAFRPGPDAETALGVEYCGLDDIWGKCDIISLHTPLTPETTGMVRGETLAKMKPNAVLINTARAELVDTEALALALREGRLLGAGLDAIDEDTAEKKPFAGIGNIVLSPHLGGNTADNVEQTAKRCAEQIIAVSRGEKLSPPHVVNAGLMAE